MPALQRMQAVIFDVDGTPAETGPDGHCPARTPAGVRHPNAASPIPLT